MGLSYNGNNRTNMAGQGNHTLANAPSGQAIMVYSDYRTEYKDPSMVDLMDRFLLLDGTIPSGIVPLVAKIFASYAQLHPQLFTEEQLKRAQNDLTKINPGNDGAIGNSMLFFACGHDTSKGQYKLDSFEDKVHVKWDGVTTEKGVQTMNREMEKYAKAQGGVYIPNPRMTHFGKRMMATHPLGGCPMGDDAQTGVVDHLGRVFTDDGKLHRGFFIVDASIIPRSLGATPLITISALAERIADHINSDPTLGM
jgi:cholesterol oxidase